MVAYCTHPVLSGNAAKNISESVLDELVVANTIPLSTQIKAVERVRQLPMSRLIGEAIRRVRNEESISAMFRY